MSKKFKKNLIKESALALFSEYGYKFVTADMIVEKAGVSKGLLFFHFKNMDGLLMELLLDWLNPKWSELTKIETVNLKLYECVEKIFQLVRANLIKNKAQYKLFYNILLNKPSLLEKLQEEESKIYKEMTLFIYNMFIDRNIDNVENEITFLSTSLMGLEVQYCIQGQNGLTLFDSSIEILIARYKLMST